ncbi:Glycosyltransferase family 4 protein [Rhodovastum atsumiense]|uniref:Glycosyltransferase family 4 protein n=1 Tax=Rhodovastum atsumiense TaxID=504468 RepID=A0A5M6IXA9_9PROT|nr:glycosyltransferase family 4 protein [Rhodovastum atsumiense]KAA5612932.1 glycosyltransferase family 4 protein [Rhodovastum atsumiense]CAH2600983.1 Glycosyltransferase family 4 protein [Rhodovastum atsumiense]
MKRSRSPGSGKPDTTGEAVAAGRGRAAAVLDDVPVTFIGRPFAPVAPGEALRGHVMACDALRLHHRVFELFPTTRTDPAHRQLMAARERHDLPGGIRIFHAGGAEVEQAMMAFAESGGRFDDGYNIIVPIYDLPVIPAQWATQLRRFDEIWALSGFIRDNLASSGLDSYWIGQTLDPQPGPCLPRRYFGVRESAFVLLHFFDPSSWVRQRNSHAVLALLDRLRRDDPYRDVQLVLQVLAAGPEDEAWATTIAGDPQVKVITTPPDSLHLRSLISACDCVVSLHHAEGGGRDLGEAMAWGRLAMGTGWSGNLDLMTGENSLLVRHRLVKLKKGDHPHWRGQSWAEPDLDHARDLLRPVLDDPERGRGIARRGQAEVLRSHGRHAVGLRILDRLERIVATAPRVLRHKRAMA